MANVFFPLTLTLDDFNRATGNLAGSLMSSRRDSWADPIEIDSDDSAVQIIQDPTPGPEGLGFGRFASNSGRGTGRTLGSYDRLLENGVEVWCRVHDANDANAIIRLWWAIANPNTAQPTGYFLEYDNVGNSLKVFRKQGASETEILAISSPPVVDVGDRLGIWHDSSIEGVIRVFFFDFDGTDEFVELGSVEDTNLEAGFLGLEADPGTATALDDFGGGQRPLKAFQKEVGVFNKVDTGVADEQTITLPFTPQAVILWCTRRQAQAVGFATHMELSYGFSDGTNHYSMNVTSDDGAATTTCDRRHAAKALTIWETVVSVNTKEAECDLAIIENGFTLDWTTNCSHEYIINYMAIGGIESAKVGTITAGAGGLGNKVFTGVGFSPDMLFFAGISDTGQPPAAAVHAMFELGWCNRGGEEAAIAITSQDALAGGSAQTTRMQVTTRCLLGMAVTGDATLEELSFVSMDDDGFTLNLDKQSFDRVWGYLALRGVESEIGVDTSGAATGDKTTAFTSTAIADPALMMYSFNRPASAVAVPDARIAIGGASEVGRRACMWGGDVDDPIAVVISDMFTGNSSLLTLVDTDNPSAADDIGELVELHPDRFVIDWTTVTSAKQFVYVALGPPKQQLADPNVECKVGTFTTRTGPGLQTIDVGFTPRALLLWGTKDTAVPANSADISNFIGLVSGVDEEWCIWGGAQDANVGPANHAYKAYAAEALLFYNISDHDSPDPANPVVRVIAHLDQFLTGATKGFRLDFTTNLDAGIIVNYMALGGGGEGLQAKLVELRLPYDIAENAEVSVAGVGFDPDVVIGLTTGRAGNGPVLDVAGTGFGFGLRNGDQGGMAVSSDIHTFEKEYTLSRPDRLTCNAPDNREGGFQGEFVARLAGMHSNGFNIKVERNHPAAQAGEGATIDRRHGFLCLKGIQGAIGHVLTRDSTGIQNLPGGDFTPIGMLLLCTNEEALQAVDDRVLGGIAGGGYGALMSFGGTDGTNEGAMWLQSIGVSALAAGDRNRAMRTNRVLRGATDAVPTNAVEASIDDFHRGGATINFNTSNSRQWELLYLLLGEANLSPTPPDVVPVVLDTEVTVIPPTVSGY